MGDQFDDAYEADMADDDRVTCVVCGHRFFFEVTTSCEICDERFCSDCFKAHQAVDNEHQQYFDQSGPTR